MTAFHQDLALCSGDHRTLRFAIADPAGAAVDLTVGGGRQRRRVIAEARLGDCCAARLAEAAAADLGQQRAFQFVGNRVFQCGGVKLLGVRHTTVVGNSFRVPVNYAVFIGAAGGEGLRVSEDILITANNITDLLTADQAGAAVDHNVGILIYQFSYLLHNVIVRGNNLAQRTSGTDGLDWSAIKLRGIAGENRQWRRDTPTGNVMFYDTTMTGEVFVGRGSAMRIEAPNALNRLTYDVDENRIDGFSEDDFVRSQSAAWDGSPELWAVPASAGEVSLGAEARFTGLDLRGYQQMRLVLNVGGQAGLTGTILYYRYSLDGGVTWYDTDAAIELDGSTHQTFWGTWQTIPPLLRQSIGTTVALFGRDGDGSMVVELVDWFVLDIRGVDHTSAARLLPRQVTPAEIADPVETELRSFSPKDIADTSSGTTQEVEATQPATEVLGGNVFVTSIGTSPGGVMLPVAVAGMRVTVHNDSGEGINVFPRSGAAILPNATDAAAYCGNNYAMTLTARSATQWYRTAYSPWA